MADAIVVDLTRYKDRSGSRVPKGRYRVQIEDVEMTKTSKTNRDMITLWLRITGGEYDGYTVIDRLTITEKALFRVVNFMQALNMPTPKKKLKITPNKWVGRTVEIDVADGEPYNGTVRSEVKGYIRPPKAKNEDTSDDFEDDDEDLTDDAEDTTADEPEETEEAPKKAPAKKAPAKKKSEGVPPIDDEDQNFGDDESDDSDDDEDTDVDVDELDI